MILGLLNAIILSTVLYSPASAVEGRNEVTITGRFIQMPEPHVIKAMARIWVAALLEEAEGTGKPYVCEAGWVLFGRDSPATVVYWRLEIIAAARKLATRGLPVTGHGAVLCLGTESIHNYARSREPQGLGLGIGYIAIAVGGLLWIFSMIWGEIARQFQTVDPALERRRAAHQALIDSHGVEYADAHQAKLHARYPDWPGI